MSISVDIIKLKRNLMGDGGAMGGGGDGGGI